MSRAYNLKFEISLIKRQLNELSFALAFGRPQSELEADRIDERLEQIGEHLRIMMRNLRNSAHLLELQRQSVRKNVPRNERWSAAESVNQKMKNVSDAQQEAKQLADDVNELLRKNGLLNPPELAKEMLENVDEIFEREMGFHTSELQQIAHGPVVTGPHASLAEDPTVAVMKLGIFAYLGIKWLKKKWSQSPKPSK
jgi:hypothetical protein